MTTERSSRDRWLFAELALVSITAISLQIAIWAGNGFVVRGILLLVVYLFAFSAQQDYVRSITGTSRPRVAAAVFALSRLVMLLVGYLFFVRPLLPASRGSFAISTPQILLLIDLLVLMALSGRVRRDLNTSP